MVVLRADPWSPEYGMGLQVRLDEKPLSADPFVETENWSAPLSPVAEAPGTIWFVDGVRRVELRLIAEDEGRRTPGLFGSFAVGAVRCDARATFADHAVDRAVVVGGGIVPTRVDIRMGSITVVFMPATDPGTEPDKPLWKLQQLMQQAEGALAARVAAGAGGMVVVDGPLTFFDATDAPVIGMVKRFVRHYLEPDQGALLGLLGPGQRTPLFALGDEQQPVHRFAWYTRLVPLRPAWHDQAGIVRCEVRAGVGLDDARRLADTVSAVLPRYAGRPSDPRAPQNLAPVGGLEAWLRHRMGHAAFIRRGLQEWMVSQS
jgi:uncharacterized protein